MCCDGECGAESEKEGYSNTEVPEKDEKGIEEKIK